MIVTELMEGRGDGNQTLQGPLGPFIFYEGAGLLGFGKYHLKIT